VNNFKNPRNLELANGIAMASGNVKSADRYFFPRDFRHFSNYRSDMIEPHRSIAVLRNWLHNRWAVKTLFLVVTWERVSLFTCSF